MTAKDLVAARLTNQLISGHKAKTPEDVVRHMGALQAQDYSQAVWALGLRTAGATLVTITEALEQKRVIRTWPMRGTIHFVLPEDAQWMLQLSAARMIAGDKRRLEQLNITVAMIEHCRDAFIPALKGGKSLTRPQMVELIKSAGVDPSGQRAYHILWYVAQTGTLCIGPMQDKQQTFMLLDEVAPHPNHLERDEAVAELAKRYFTSHGPATLKDFAGWSGLTLTEAKAGHAANAHELSAQTIDGTEYWQPKTQPLAANGVYLLPGFDEYFLGYRDRSAIVDASHAAKVVPGGNGIFKAMVISDGRVIGTWLRKPTTRALGIQVTLFTSVTAKTKAAIERAAANYAAFAGSPLGSVTVDH